MGLKNLFIKEEEDNIETVAGTPIQQTQQPETIITPIAKAQSVEVVKPKKQKKQKATYSYSGDFIFKDVPLMKIEPLLVAGAGILAFFGIIIGRVFSFGVVNLESEMTPGAFTEVATIVNNVNQLNLMFMLLVLLIPAAIFAYKFFVLYPRKDKVIVRRRYASGASRTSIEAINPDGTIKFSAGKGLFGTDKELHDMVSIINPGKNWEIGINKPVIDIKEGHETNTELFSDADYSRNVYELNDLLTLRFNTGYECGYYDASKESKGPQIPKALLVVLIVGAGIAALAVMYIMKNPGILG